MPSISVDPKWFARERCLNCGAQLGSLYCGQCGQKAAHRLVFKDIGKESWDRFRFFEIKSARTIFALFKKPGTVARDYVLGRRTRYMNPLTLMIALVAFLVLALAANQYFAHYAFAGQDAVVDRMAARVIAYANWSFSLGIVAIFLASSITFRRRLNYNAVEHAVLATFCQCVILTLILVNMLPTLIWRDASFIIQHKAASQYYVPLIKLLIVAVAFKQFFLLDLKADWLRLTVACAVYSALNWLLLRAYAAAILWIISVT